MTLDWLTSPNSRGAESSSGRLYLHGRRLDRAGIETVEPRAPRVDGRDRDGLGRPCRPSPRPGHARTRAIRGRCRLFDAAFGTRLGLRPRDDAFNPPPCSTVLDRLRRGPARRAGGPPGDGYPSAGDAVRGLASGDRRRPSHSLPRATPARPAEAGGGVPGCAGRQPDRRRPALPGLNPTGLTSVGRMREGRAARAGSPRGPDRLGSPAPTTRSPPTSSAPSA